MLRNLFGSSIRLVYAVRFYSNVHLNYWKLSEFFVKKKIIWDNVLNQKQDS